MLHHKHVTLTASNFKTIILVTNYSTTVSMNSKKFRTREIVNYKYSNFIFDVCQIFEDSAETSLSKLVRTPYMFVSDQLSDIIYNL